MSLQKLIARGSKKLCSRSRRGTTRGRPYDSAKVSLFIRHCRPPPTNYPYPSLVLICLLYYSTINDGSGVHIFGGQHTKNAGRHPTSAKWPHSPPKNARGSRRPQQVKALGISRYCSQMLFRLTTPGERCGFKILPQRIARSNELF